MFSLLNAERHGPFFGQAVRQMKAPWRDRRGQLSLLKCTGLAVAAGPAVLMASDWYSGAFGPLPIIGLVYWSGIWATALLLLTLSITPARHVFGWARLIEVRRMFGLAGLIYSVVHLFAFFALYRWDASSIFQQVYSRISLIVATASLAGLLVLGATSSDAAVRWLGATTWHRLHRANYVLILLAVTHFLLSPGIFNLQYVAAGCLFFLLAWRFLHARGMARAPTALALLSVGAGTFVFVFEIGWLWAYQHVPVADTISEALNFDDEVPPHWQVLGAGLLISAGAALLPAMWSLKRPIGKQRLGGSR